MIKINLNAESVEDALSLMQAHLGGVVTERWGEHTLNFDNAIAKGCIRCISFDWGVSLLEFDALFFEEIEMTYDNVHINPIHFSYCSKGFFKSRFDNEDAFQTIKEYHSAIIVSKKNQRTTVHFPKDIHIIINDIRIIRKEFLKKRNNQLSELNDKLHKVFIDKNHEFQYAYYSPIHLRMEDFVKELRDLKSEGIIRVLQIEAEIYQLLSMHIARHDRNENHNIQPHSLLKDEIKIIRRYANKILEDPALSYSLDQISRDSGLSQAKLQEGFKFLFARTVTEYIRHTRLEAARDLMNTTELNISQIVYTIGFTSRSYFSKIFKEKYNITPHEFKKQVVVISRDDEEIAKY